MKTKRAADVLLGVIAGTAAGTALACFHKENRKNDLDKAAKFKKYYQILNQWILLKNKGGGLEEYFVKNGYQSIAIYGMGEIGERFLEETRVSEKLKVCYAIDRDAAHTLTDIEVKTLEDELDGVDVIVVAAVYAYHTAKKQLEDKTEIPVISLEQVIQELL